MPKFIITITKEIIDKSLMWGNNNLSVAGNCAFAKAFQEFIPNVVVSTFNTFFLKNFKNTEAATHMINCDVNNTISIINNSISQIEFIYRFDSYKNTPYDRYSLVGQQFEVEIPQKVIDHYYQDSVDEVNKILANSTSLQLV